MAGLKYGISLFLLTMIINYLSGVPFLFDKTLKIDRFLGQCAGYKNLSIYFKDTRFVRVRRVYYISTKIVAVRNVSDNVKVVLKLERCKSREVLDSCEPYQDVLIKNICELVGAGFQPWTPFINTLEPSFTCPLSKGTYTCKNGTFDGTILTALALEGWYWKVKALVSELDGTRGDIVIMCVYLEGQVTNV